MKYINTINENMNESYIIYGMKRRIPEVQEWGNDYIIEECGRDGEYGNRTYRKFPTPVFNSNKGVAEVLPLKEYTYSEYS